MNLGLGDGSPVPRCLPIIQNNGPGSGCNSREGSVSASQRGSPDPVRLPDGAAPSHVSRIAMRVGYESLASLLLEAFGLKFLGHGPKTKALPEFGAPASIVSPTIPIEKPRSTDPEAFNS